jgi:hypothetical protein
MKKENKLQALLIQLDLNLELLKKAQELMNYSQNKCQDIIKKPLHSELTLWNCLLRFLSIRANWIQL